MTIALFGRNVNEEFLPYLWSLVRRFQEKGAQVICEATFAKIIEGQCPCHTCFDGIYDRAGLADFQSSLLLSIGGDGTFLDAVVYIKDNPIPILGINSGRLGFLANVPVNEIDEAVEAICEGRYEYEEREMLQLEVNGSVLAGFEQALNEVSVLKTSTSSLLKIHAYIGEAYLTTYWADGLIIATPTGSTAYSLSGGGPIVSPDCRNIILTPVCAHNLSIRPLVVPNDAVIRLRVEGRSGEFVLSMDSRLQKMNDGVELKITTAKNRVQVVKLEHHNYYDTLRNKLMWGEDVRNEKDISFDYRGEQKSL